MKKKLCIILYCSIKFKRFIRARWRSGRVLNSYFDPGSFNPAYMKGNPRILAHTGCGRKCSYP